MERIIKRGDKFNCLTVIREVESGVTPSGRRIRKIECMCECGCKKIISLWEIKNTNHLKCSCKMSFHKQSWRKEYKIWGSMIQRCNNSKNKRWSGYGGRGISVCERWSKFENFFKDMGERPKGNTLDRVDNDKGYHKDNCRWTTVINQQNNMRSNHFVEYNGEKLTIAKWSRKLKLPYGRLYSRINRGW